MGTVKEFPSLKAGMGVIELTDFFANQWLPTM